MKHKIILLTVVMLVVIMGSTVQAATTPDMYLNDVKVLNKERLGVPFINDEGVMMVPLEGLMQYFGTEVQELEDSDGLKFTSDAYEMTFIPGDAFYVRNGFRISLGTEIVQDGIRLYVPVRRLMESLGLKVLWDGEAYAVMLKSDEAKVAEIREQLQNEGVVFSADLKENEIQFTWPEEQSVDYYMLYLMTEEWQPQRAARIIFPKHSSYYRPGYFDAASLDEEVIYFKASAVVEGVESQLSEAVEVILK